MATSEAVKEAAGIGSFADKRIGYDDVSNHMLVAHTALKAFCHMTERMKENNKAGKWLLEGWPGMSNPENELNNLYDIAMIALAGVDAMFDKFGIASPLRDKELSDKGAMALAFCILKTREDEKAKKEAGHGV